MGEEEGRGGGFVSESRCAARPRNHFIGCHNSIGFPSGS